MKVALTVDAILSRDHYTEVIEAILSIYKEAQIYTFTHNQGAVIGPIEMRKIKSSAAFSKKSSWDEIKKIAYLAPAAAKKMYISCQFDLVISLTRGLGHTFFKCDDAKKITIVYDEYLIDGQKSLSQKIFKAYLNKRSEKFLKDNDLFIPSHLQANFEKSYPQVKSVRYYDLPIKIEDFQIIKSPTFNYDYLAIEASLITNQDLNNLLKLDRKLVLFGSDEHLDKDNFSSEKFIFWGEKCAGELAPMFAGSLAVLATPLWAIKALATGRPVISLSECNHIDLIKAYDYVYVLSDLSKLTESIDSILSQEIDSKLCRANALKHHETKFKKMISQYMTQ